MRYAVLTQAPSTDGDGAPRLFGTWKNRELAQEFADRVNEKVRAAMDAAVDADRHDDGGVYQGDVRHHLAVVLLVRPPKLRGPGGGYEWVCDE
jgi:hypothetical protein